METHNDFGKRGEKAAAAFLEQRGYTLLERNYRYLKAEVDLVARKGDVLAFVEVKSRKSDDYGPVAETVTAKKIKLMVMAADHYVVERDLDVEVRFDIVTVTENHGRLELEHLKSAFFHF